MSLISANNNNNNKNKPLKWTIILKINQNLTKFLKKHIRKPRCDLCYSNDFLDRTPKAKSMREITDKPNFIKIKNFSLVKDNGKHKKINCKRYMWFQCLLPKIYKELQNSTTDNNQINMEKGLNTHWHQQKYTDGKWMHEKTFATHCLRTAKVTVLDLYSCISSAKIQNTDNRIEEQQGSSSPLLGRQKGATALEVSYTIKCCLT